MGSLVVVFLLLMVIMDLGNTSVHKDRTCQKANDIFPNQMCNYCIWTPTKYKMFDIACPGENIYLISILTVGPTYSTSLKTAQYPIYNNSNE